MDSITKKQRGDIRSTTWKKGQSGNPTGRPLKYTKRDNIKEQWRSSRLRSKYGISIEQYEEMFIAQNGVCAICGNPEMKMQSRRKGQEKTLDRLHVDHDHVTGKVRGLICYRCNTGIGKLNDDPDLLRKAARYIGYVLEE